MKIYDNKEEAMNAAEALRVQLVDGHFYTVMNGTDSNMVVLYNNHTGTVTAEFRYKPQRVAPAKGQAVRSEKTGRIFFSKGNFDGDGYLMASVSPDPDCYPIPVDTFTPVEITPAGQFAKAVELLECSLLTTHDRFATWPDEARKLLDEIKAGGE